MMKTSGERKMIREKEPLSFERGEGRILYRV